MRPDDSMRDRLRALADKESLPQLSAAARARVEVKALSECRHGEVRRTRAFALGMAIVAMGALAVVRTLLLDAPADHEARLQATRTTQSAELVGASVKPVACLQHEGSVWRRDGAGRQVLDLASRALLVAGAEASISHELSASCDLRADLLAGSVAVHARDLQGGRLVVHTQSGDVTVKGTVFEVEFDARRSELRVNVDEGLVEVRTAAEVVEVRPGDSLLVGSRIVRARLAKPLRDALRQRLGLSLLGSAAQPKPPQRELPLVDSGARKVSPGDVPQPSDEPRAWHSGSVDVPQIPPQPGTSVTEEGRPMQKPRLVEER